MNAQHTDHLGCLPNHIPARRRVGRLGSDDGQITVAYLILLPALLVLAGLVVDGGAALDLHTQALDVAESAARAGAQQLDLTALRAGHTLTPRLDPGAATATAERYVHSAGLAGTAQATTSQVHVEVTASGRTRLLGVIGIDSFHAHAAASAQPDTGTNS
ncbi:pilus assembly protein TadG-related protein [Actinocatenispora comari]|uniref:Membrane protein n=1 Tax=Actinocatenispora comari TaxID=2807577 RepID=A0A8J4A910_9ACTN|nr:pilus assembly protein TadG-related protein [Actinocatenispora comari]GIL25520.1 membrane protein [Actinocatenispora comari]